MQWRHPVLDQRFCLTARRRGRCWQLRGNLGRWCGPRMNLGYYATEEMARQVGGRIGQRVQDGGATRWWSPLDVWWVAVAESDKWIGQVKVTLSELCPLWVRKAADGKYLHLFGPSVHLSPMMAHLTASIAWRDYWDARLREQIDELRAKGFGTEKILNKLVGWQSRWSDGRAVGLCDIGGPV